MPDNNQILEEEMQKRTDQRVWKDFKNFIARGNVIDLAIGVIIGAAFTTIIKSLVDDVIMPIVGLFTQGIDFSQLYINLSGDDYATLQDAQAAGAATLNYGLFINAVLNFLIVAAIIFFALKAVNKLKDKADDPNDSEIKTPQDILYLKDIRDMLEKKL